MLTPEVKGNGKRMKDHNDIRNFIETRRSTESLVLCTLVRKSGSSYRAPGAKKVVSLSGGAIGFLSGGCLEASIEKTARDRFSELPFIASFSTLAEEDRLLGFQTGCQGVIEILFENAGPGDLDLLIPYGTHPRFNFVSVNLSAESLGKRLPCEEIHNDADLFFEKWLEPVQLYIIGCGADADIYGPLANSMGWSVTFLDYRSSLMTEGRFAPNRAQTVPVSETGSHVPEGGRVAVVLMTHNFEADLEILRSMKNHRAGYLGCLGPAARFERLQTDLLSFHEEKLSPHLLSRAFAPAGIFTKGKSPEEIALSVVAQIQGELVEEAPGEVWTMVLAAGSSSRFGSPKALAKIEGETLVARAVKTAQEVSGENVLVVTGAYDFADHLGEVDFARNPHWESGMGGSIAFGLKQILVRTSKLEMLTILPVDQPGVSAEHLLKLISSARAAKRCALTVSGEDSGPPAAIPNIFFNYALELHGDSGLKTLLRKDQIIYVENPEAFADMDSPQDLTGRQAVHARAERFEQA